MAGIRARRRSMIDLPSLPRLPADRLLRALGICNEQLRRQVDPAPHELAAALFDADCHLIVYGSLAPGESNHGEVESLGGEWTAGWIHGTLYQIGWGAAMGFPALVWDPRGPRVDAYLLRSPALRHDWTRLDAFEGSQYARVLAPFHDESGIVAVGYVYQSANPPVS